ncbi:MAG: hypothetical protein P8J29_05460 [Rhodospirillales bacterium]|nr:hypothetical protein [Rhodospirillales bacterium]
MTAYISGPLITFCLLPLVATVLIAAAIRFFGGRPTNDRLVSASAGVGIVWVTVLVLGMPGFPPPLGSAALPMILLAGLVVGSLLDQFLPVFHNRARLWDTALDFAFAIGAIAWFRDGLDLWGMVIFVAWGTLQIQLRRYTVRNSIPAVMMLLSAGGLVLIAWSGNAPGVRDLALGVLGVTLGLSIWLFLNRSLPIGFGYLWGGFTAQILITLRMIESNPALTAPIAVLGFIFYADTAAASLAVWKPALKKVPSPLMTGVVSIFPLTLAIVIAAAVSQLAQAE